MAAIAAIDVGSNAMRIAVASVGPGAAPRLIQYARAPVRLGRDVFEAGSISPETAARAVEAVAGFRNLMEVHGVTRWRAVATSAVREAANRDEFLARIAVATGVDIEPITGEEEARLVFRAVAAKVDLCGQVAAILDVGGGSAEVSIAVDGRVIRAETLPLGAVRLLQVWNEPGAVDRLLQQAVPRIDGYRRAISREVGHRRVQLCVGVGGNIDALGDLRRVLLGKRAVDRLQRDELAALIEAIGRLSVAERVGRLGLRPDRADVILPAAVVVAFFLRRLAVARLAIPRVNLKDGILAELAEAERSDPHRDWPNPCRADDADPPEKDES